MDVGKMMDRDDRQIVFRAATSVDYYSLGGVWQSALRGKFKSRQDLPFLIDFTETRYERRSGPNSLSVLY
jgi:hypothetical protein